MRRAPCRLICRRKRRRQAGYALSLLRSRQLRSLTNIEKTFRFFRVASLGYTSLLLSSEERGLDVGVNDCFRVVPLLPVISSALTVYRCSRPRERGFDFVTPSLRSSGPACASVPSDSVVPAGETSHANEERAH